MSDNKPLDQLILELQERAKELTCLYQMQELLNDHENTTKDICKGLVVIIPPGWQYPDICRAKISLMGEVYHSGSFNETPWVLRAEILIQN